MAVKQALLLENRFDSHEAHLTFLDYPFCDHSRPSWELQGESSKKGEHIRCLRKLGLGKC